MEEVIDITTRSLGSERRRMPSTQTASSAGEVVRTWQISGTTRCRIVLGGVNR